MDVDIPGRCVCSLPVFPVYSWRLEGGTGNMVVWLSCWSRMKRLWREEGGDIERPLRVIPHDSQTRSEPCRATRSVQPVSQSVSSGLELCFLTLYRISISVRLHLSCHGQITGSCTMPDQHHGSIQISIISGRHENIQSEEKLSTPCRRCADLEYVQGILQSSPGAWQDKHMPIYPSV